jgi:hypothetical protein
VKQWESHCNFFINKGLSQVQYLQRKKELLISLSLPTNKGRATAWAARSRRSPARGCCLSSPAGSGWTAALVTRWSRYTVGFQGAPMPYYPVGKRVTGLTPSDLSWKRLLLIHSGHSDGGDRRLLPSRWCEKGAHCDGSDHIHSYLLLFPVEFNAMFMPKLDLLLNFLVCHGMEPLSQSSLENGRCSIYVWHLPCPGCSPSTNVSLAIEL